MHKPVVSPESSFSSNEVLILDSHKFLLAGVILEPSKPSKGFINIMAYDDGEGLVNCQDYGPYQGWIADFFPETSVVKEGKREVTKEQLFILKNGSGGRVRFSEIDITNIDCKGEM